MTVEGYRIAIVGVSCRVPGANGPAEFWEFINRGRSAISNDPHYEQLVSTASDNEAIPEGLKYSAQLAGALGFDAPFFGISDTEGENMDPQQRITLELAWEAFEDARLVPENFRSKSVGLFIGAMRDDFSRLMSGLSLAPNPRSTLGSLRSVIAGRISHFFGLKGPSLVVDTAQSSSLVAIKLAIDSLRRGECDLAIAGGVHLNLDPQMALSIAELGVLSNDGICRPFDDAANGYVRGEGGGFVVLARVADAIECGHRMYCEIRDGAAINDGARRGLTAPTADGHERLLRAALAGAGVEAHQVQYIETHGTGTPVGDAAEAQSIVSAYCSDGRANDLLLIGSVKPNVGHLEGAAGVIGVIKIALALKHRAIPPTLNFVQPNKALAGHQASVRVVTEGMPWPVSEHVRTAAVSSFGISGTNAHVIVQQAP
ncbi:beta-ketoacyl [acyl carrier protein] synthase domain-containing protein, partial [Mycobacterium szulgai]